MYRIRLNELEAQTIFTLDNSSSGLLIVILINYLFIKYIICLNKKITLDFCS